MSKQNPIIGIVGAGPIGSVLGAYLAESGAQILVSDIAPRNNQIRSVGLQVDLDETQLRHSVSVVDSIKSLKEYNPSCLIVSTKANILNLIIPELAKAASDNCLVISAQNGIDPEEKIAEFIPRTNIARMVINFTGTKPNEDGIIKANWLKPPNFIGHLTDENNPILKQIVEMLNTSGLTINSVDPQTIKKKAFLKTALNAALMPLCAVLGMTMKEAMDNPITRKLAGEILAESLSVASKLGYRYDDNIWEICMGYLDKGGDHHPSMSHDLNNGLPTEIDFINGAILEKGISFDLNLETNKYFVSLLVAQEVQGKTRSIENIPKYIL